MFNQQYTRLRHVVVFILLLGYSWLWKIETVTSPFLFCCFIFAVNITQTRKKKRFSHNTYNIKYNNSFQTVNLHQHEYLMISFSMNKHHVLYGTPAAGYRTCHVTITILSTTHLHENRKESDKNPFSQSVIDVELKSIRTMN